jgi:hypothetical protein
MSASPEPQLQATVARGLLGAGHQQRRAHLAVALCGLTP